MDDNMPFTFLHPNLTATSFPPLRCRNLILVTLKHQAEHSSTKKQVQALLGLAEHNQSLVPNDSSLAVSSQICLRLSGLRWQTSSEAECAFCMLKTAPTYHSLYKQIYEAEKHPAVFISQQLILLHCTVAVNANAEGPTRIYGKWSDQVNNIPFQLHSPPLPVLQLRTSHEIRMVTLVL